MALSNKQQTSQVFRLMLYQRALHPELFKIKGRITFSTPNYEVEAWIMPNEHLIRFQSNGHCLSELVADQSSQLPERGLVHSLPCIGEKEYEQKVDNTLNYVAAVQTECLTENLFNATLSEMRDFAADSNALVVDHVTDDGIKNFSMLDLQTYRKEIHIQGYHMIGATGFILRTQSIFEVL